MKTKTLIFIFKKIDEILGLMLEEQNEIKLKNLIYDYNVITGSLLKQLHFHWKHHKMNYNWQEVESSLSPSVQGLYSNWEKEGRFRPINIPQYKSYEFRKKYK